MSGHLLVVLEPSICPAYGTWHSLPRCSIVRNVLVQDLLEQVMHWHFVLLAAFFMES
jgi:hypothetical protein